MCVVLTCLFTWLESDVGHVRLALLNLICTIRSSVFSVLPLASLICVLCLLGLIGSLSTYSHQERHFVPTCLITVMLRLHIFDNADVFSCVTVGFHFTYNIDQRNTYIVVRTTKDRQDNTGEVAGASCLLYKSI